MKKDVLGVKIDDIHEVEALGIVINWLENRGKHYIVTPNPEMVVMAQKDTQLRRIINEADLAIPDGKGLNLFTDIVCNIPGTDFMEDLVELAAEKGFTVGFLGGRDGVAGKVSECLQKKYPKLKVTYAESGGEVDKKGNAIIPKILPPVKLLFVALGPPKQEKWIVNNLNNGDFEVAMGVGGAFDFLSGGVPRAPRLLRMINLEWFFRLLIQPWRIKRQLSLIKFVWLLWKTR
jgi:N-acetylglucosaminyldiphosphoundecaprenol N-acetyl-beta-D-mannosaminyltransferase